LIAFTEANAVLIAERPEVDFWARLFAEAHAELRPTDMARIDAGE
jgi:hypothetical protein